jgi:uncharacterized membrane protein HdeD (DUF308 family)
MSMAQDSASVSEPRWGWVVAIGVLFAILGIVALFNVVDATIITTIIIGWLLAFAGIMHVVGAFTSGESLGWRVAQGLLGVLYVVVGLNLVFNPLEGTLALTVALAILLVVDGVIRIIASIMDRHDAWVLTLILGFLNILIGFWLWTGFPVSGLAIGFFAGLQLLIVGVMWIFAGFAARSARNAMAPA